MTDQNTTTKPCRYACAAFPHCGCEVDELSPPAGICICGDPVMSGFLACEPCFQKYHQHEQPLMPWDM